VSRKTRNRAARCQGCTGTPVSSFNRNYTTTVTAYVFMAGSRCVHDLQVDLRAVPQPTVSAGSASGDASVL
jgi:hypothetical protein